MTSVEEKRALRLRFMRLLYEVTDGDEIATVDMRQIGGELELSEQQTAHLVQYLIGEGLAKWAAMGGFVRITHRGVVEMEQSLSTPTQATEHFPPAINVIHVQSMVGSQIQQGTIQSSQSITSAQPDEVEAVRKFVSRVRAMETELGLSADAKQDLDAEIATLEAQTNSRSPKRSVFRAVAESVGNILKSAPAQAAAVELAKDLPKLLGRDSQ